MIGTARVAELANTPSGRLSPRGDNQMRATSALREWVRRPCRRTSERRRNSRCGTGTATRITGCCSRRSGPARPTGFARVAAKVERSRAAGICRILKTAGVRPVTIHGLRHTSAALLLKAGVAPHVMQQRLGHKKLPPPSTSTRTPCRPCSRTRQSGWVRCSKAP